ncbi:type I polyketide synthase [Kitasatospora sp. NPDC001159]
MREEAEAVTESEYDEDGYEEDRIAVVGLACRVPGAADAAGFWQNLLDGVESITVGERGPDDPPGYVPATGRLDALEEFDAEFFGMTPREAEYADPQHRLFLEQCWVALEHAGVDPARAAGRIGVWGGCGFNGYLPLNLLPHLAAGDVLREYPAELLHGNDKDYLTSRVAYRLGLDGPAVTVQTACSTSLVAVVQACQALLDYQCDTALAGGASVKLPQDWGYVHETGGIQSPDGHCRPFDASAAGTVFTSGVGVVVLKRLADALADGDRVHAVILGSAVNNDGARKVGYAAPSVDGQRAAIADAYRSAGISPATVGYVEAHGTGTAVGDPIELAALDAVFAPAGAAPGSVAIGSVKSNLGHLNAASGVIGLLKAVLAVREDRLPASLHYRERNPRTDPASPFAVNTDLRPWPAAPGPRRAGVSSFGVGGTNVHLVVEQPPAPTAPGAVREQQLLTLSAHSAEALAEARTRLAARLREDTAVRLADFAHTLQRGRRQFDHRTTVVAADPLAAADALERATDRAPAAPLRAALLFPGQGSQYRGMAAELLRTEAEFAAHVAECAELLAPELGRDLRTLLDRRPAPGEPDPLTATELAQPALFTVGYALARWWQSTGVQPVALLGHSIGEWAAACLAGVFELPDALRLVAARGRLMAALPPGAMVAVELKEDEARALAEEHGLSLAAVNGPRRCVLAGPEEAVERLARQVPARRLVTSHAFHSAMLDPMTGPFAELVATVARHKPTVPFLSNVSGTWITAEQAVDPQYWARQARATVRFADGAAALLAAGRPLLVEAGPGRVLGRLVGELDPDVRAVASLPGARETGGDQAVLLRALGAAWEAGVAVDWKAFGAAEQRRTAELPGHLFRRRRHWIDAPGSVRTEPHGPDTVPDTPAEEQDVTTQVLALWRELLGTDVTPADDLFELGGDSLLVTRLASRANRLFGVELPLDDLLDDPTPARMAELVTTARSGTEPNGK